MQTLPAATCLVEQLCQTRANVNIWHTCYLKQLSTDPYSVVIDRPFLSSCAPWATLEAVVKQEELLCMENVTGEYYGTQVKLVLSFGPYSVIQFQVSLTSDANQSSKGRDPVAKGLRRLPERTHLQCRMRSTLVKKGMKFVFISKYVMQHWGKI